LEAAQKSEDGNRKVTVLSDLAMILATEPHPEERQDYYSLYYIKIPRMKKSFTPEEKQFAKQLVEAVQEN